jgi:hypothetical protein
LRPVDQATDGPREGIVPPEDFFGGITTKRSEEITHGDYPAIADMLIGAGALLPDRLGWQRGRAGRSSAGRGARSGMRAPGDAEPGCQAGLSPDGQVLARAK